MRRYEISLKNGATVCTDSSYSSAEEHARAMEMMAQFERIGLIDPEDRPLRSAAKPAKSEPITSAVDKRIANCSGKNGERTVDTKVYHIKDFLERSFPLVESVERWLALHEKVEFNKSKGLRQLEENKAAGRHSSADIEVSAIGKGPTLRRFSIGLRRKRPRGRVSQKACSTFSPTHLTVTRFELRIGSPTPHASSLRRQKRRKLSYIGTNSLAILLSSAAS